MLNTKEDQIPSVTTSKKKIVSIVLFVTGLIVCILIFILYRLSLPPADFIDGKAFEIERGMSVQQIAAEAQEQGITKSDLLLYAILTYFHNPRSIHAGTYRFEQTTNVFGVAKKIAQNDVDKDLISLTIPEGMRSTNIATIAKEKLPLFNVDEYLTLTDKKEGYLFPETYFVPETFTAEDLIDLQTETYEDNVAPLREQIANSHFSEYEVLILASIIEREANDETSMKMVSGILQNRLEIGMALQTDASIEYVLDKPLPELVPADLEIDSLYNTYLYPGLVPTPIGNPGLQSIHAVLEPTLSDNYYYMTDDDGTFYYAQTFSEHKQNIARYLR